MLRADDAEQPADAHDSENAQQGAPRSHAAALHSTAIADVEHRAGVTGPGASRLVQVSWPTRAGDSVVAGMP